MDCNICQKPDRAYVPTLPHTEQTVTGKAPTCTEDGGTYAYCQVCGEDKLTTQPATGHNYVDGECTNCGDVAKG